MRIRAGGKENWIRDACSFMDSEGATLAFWKPCTCMVTDSLGKTSFVFLKKNQKKTMCCFVLVFFFCLSVSACTNSFANCRSLSEVFLNACLVPELTVYFWNSVRKKVPLKWNFKWKDYHLKGLQLRKSFLSLVIALIILLLDVWTYRRYSMLAVHWSSFSINRQDSSVTCQWATGGTWKLLSVLLSGFLTGGNVASESKKDIFDF